MSYYIKHSAKGSSWKKNVKYIAKYFKNGKIIYKYPDDPLGNKTRRRNMHEAAMRYYVSKGNYEANPTEEKRQTMYKYKGEYARARRAYNKSPIGRLEKSVSNGKKHIEAKLNKLKNSIKKPKKKKLKKVKKVKSKKINNTIKNRIIKYRDKIDKKLKEADDRRISVTYDEAKLL